MIIGHFPAGYLTACGLRRAGATRTLFLGCLLGAVLPDIDLFWFYLVESSYHHHTLFTHRPVLWLAVLLAGLSTKNSFATGVGIGGLLHMVLDSFAGAIAWLWPVSSASYPLIVVEPTHGHWLLSFMAHWFFKVELAIVFLALCVFLLRKRRKI